MGVIAVDFHVDSYVATGSTSLHEASLATHIFLTKEELEARYGLYRGSGGSLSGFSNATYSGTNNAPVLVQSEVDNKLASVVHDICFAFGLTKEELAKVCQVQSRKTLYNWIDGKATPRKSAMSRIFDLLIISQAWMQAGFSSDKVSLHSPILDGVSIFELLSLDVLDKELIIFAGSRLNLSSSIQGSLEDPFA